MGPRPKRLAALETSDAVHRLGRVVAVETATPSPRRPASGLFPAPVGVTDGPGELAGPPRPRRPGEVVTLETRPASAGLRPIPETGAALFPLAVRRVRRGLGLQVAVVRVPLARRPASVGRTRPETVPPGPQVVPPGVGRLGHKTPLPVVLQGRRDRVVFGLRTPPLARPQVGVVRAPAILAFSGLVRPVGATAVGAVVLGLAGTLPRPPKVPPVLGPRPPLAIAAGAVTVVARQGTQVDAGRAPRALDAGGVTGVPGTATAAVTAVEDAGPPFPYRPALAFRLGGGLGPTEAGGDPAARTGTVPTRGPRPVFRVPPSSRRPFRTLPSLRTVSSFPSVPAFRATGVLPFSPTFCRVGVLMAWLSSL